jgi:hypothetical protein
MLRAAFAHQRKRRARPHQARPHFTLEPTQRYSVLRLRVPAVLPLPLWLMLVLWFIALALVFPAARPVLWLIADAFVLPPVVVVLVLVFVTTVVLVVAPAFVFVTVMLAFWTVMLALPPFVLSLAAQPIHRHTIASKTKRVRVLRIVSPPVALQRSISSDVNQHNSTARVVKFDGRDISCQ